MADEDIVLRLRRRAEIRRAIPTRKSVQEGQPDRISDLLEEAATHISELAGQRGRALLLLETRPGQYDDKDAVISEQCDGIIRRQAEIARLEEDSRRMAKALNYLSGEIGKVAHGEPLDALDLLVAVERGLGLGAKK